MAQEEKDNLVRQVRFPLLLATLFAIILIPPYYEGQEIFEMVWRISFSLVMLAALATLAGARHTLLVAALLLVPAFVTNWIPMVHDAAWVVYADNLTTIVYLSLVGYFIGRYVFTSQTVTANVLYAAMCLYMIIALIWAAIYNNMHIYYIDAFQFGTDALEDLALNPSSTLGLFSYYSFVTMTTLGYGDIVPLTRVTQSWAAVEAMVGQFYIAIVMARLVSLHVANRND